MKFIQKIILCWENSKNTIWLIKKNRKFCVRLVSYGAPNPNKMYLGPSHLAHAFDKLMFDYVFVFLESEK